MTASITPKREPADGEPDRDRVHRLMAQPQLDHRPITDRACAPARVGRVAGGVSRAQFPDVVILHVAVAQQRQGAAGELAASARRQVEGVPR